MNIYDKPYSYLLEKNFIDSNRFQTILKEYPSDYIKRYCSNPEVSEYASALEGNYSAPVTNLEFTNWIEYDVLPVLKDKFLNDQLAHDHHYCNYHMDDPGSSLGIHNDLKGFRWLITTQIYLDNGTDGARLLDMNANCVIRVPQEHNLAYSIFTTPYSWHDVPEIQQLKRSVLFRVGKKRSRSVAHSDNWDTQNCYIIINDHHCDTHYAKLGPRMGNLTEAWLWKQGVKNIYHSDWRDSASLRRVIKYALQHHKIVRCIQSGYFPSCHPDQVCDNEALKTVTDHRVGYIMSHPESRKNCVMVTDDNYKDIADVVFRENDKISLLVEAEEILKEYTDSHAFLNYRDISLPKI
jgi:hypothetical protein